MRNQGRSAADQWLLHERLGYNFRLSDINCALGLAQLSRIDEIKAKRSQVVSWYQEMLADEERLILPTTPEGGDISWFVFVVQLAESFTGEQRDRVLEQMRRQGIQVSNYFPPIHIQPFIAARYGHGAGDFPVCEQVAARTVALPFHTQLTTDDVALVCGALRGILDTI